MVLDIQVEQPVNKCRQFRPFDYILERQSGRIPRRPHRTESKPTPVISKELVM
jgi:hypothetical protein